MNYKKAIDVLPAELLSAVQSYADGEYIYIPRKKGNEKAWGEKTKSKVQIYERNFEIFEKNQQGVSVQILSEAYYLAPKSIQKIIAKMKSES